MTPRRDTTEVNTGPRPYNGSFHRDAKAVTDALIASCVPITKCLLEGVSNRYTTTYLGHFTTTARHNG